MSARHSQFEKHRSSDGGLQEVARFSDRSLPSFQILDLDVRPIILHAKARQEQMSLIKISTGHHLRAL